MNIMANKIKYILSLRNMTIKDLAKKLGKSERYFYNKFYKGVFTIEELEEIASALECDFDGVFTLRDSGTKI